MTFAAEGARIARELLADNPAGLSFRQILLRLCAALPDASEPTLRRVINDLPRSCAGVRRVARGWYGVDSSGGTGVPACGSISNEVAIPQAGTPVPPNPTVPPTNSEERFYPAFARCLAKLEGCTRCIPVGGNRLGGDGGTPDVLGRCSPPRDAAVPFADIIVAGELKTGHTRLVHGYGQACAYRVFAHKCYFAVRADLSEERLARLDAQCDAGGIGLVTFDAADPQCGGWSVRVRARQGCPDPRLLNEKLEAIRDELYG